MNIQEEIKVKNKKTDYFLILLLFAFCNESILSYAKVVFDRLPIIKYVSGYIIPAVFILLIILCIATGRFGKTKVSDVLLIIAFLLVITVSYILYTSNREVYNAYNMKMIFFQAIPFFILGLNFTSDEKTIRWLTYASYFAILINVLYIIYFISTREMSNDAMYWSYLLLPHTMFAIRSIFGTESKKRRIIALIFSIAGIIYAIAMGTRGPILIIAVYLCILIFTKSRKKTGIKLLFVFLAISVIALIYSGVYLVILQYIRGLFVDFGVSTRAIDYVISGEYLSHTSGRDVLYDIMLEKLNLRPLLGYGVFGEWQFINYSAHNIWFELCMHYGYIIGTALVLIFLFIIGKAYLKSKNEFTKDLILLFACFTIVRGVFGGDYMDYEVTFLLGLCINELRTNRRHILS